LYPESIIKIAKAHGSNLVHISTDKAVDPINIMGASKRACEILVLNETESILGTFKIVRFGNVLNSSGSVVPIFRDQIKNGGPITITNSKAERFFMTMEQAVRLVIKCQYVAKNENILVLDMGKPVFIDALARDMIADAGLNIVTSETPGKNEIVINYIGLREGEKLTEQLTYGRLIATNVPGIFSALEDGGVYDQVLTKINELVEKREAINPSDLKWY
jgi:FlaA1/EpsC-like NDP-sugar epimerase